jgi:flagellar motor protein MotB
MKRFAILLIAIISAGCAGNDLALVQARARSSELESDLKRRDSEITRLARQIEQARGAAADLKNQSADVNSILAVQPGEESFAVIKGDLIQMSSVIFASGQYEITESRAVDALDRWARRLAQQDVLQISIEGHTDTDPILHARATGVQNNPHLSVLRAAAVANRLIAAGVSESKVVISGFGASKPVDAANKSANRRVEIRISMDKGAEKPSSVVIPK